VHLRNKHLTRPKGQMELKMKQSMSDAWSVTLQVHPAAFCVSCSGLFGDVDHCRGVVQVTLGVQSVQVYLCGLVPTLLKRAM